jgi:hypothetical protein
MQGLGCLHVGYLAVAVYWCHFLPTLPQCDFLDMALEPSFAMNCLKLHVAGGMEKGEGGFQLARV